MSDAASQHEQHEHDAHEHHGPSLGFLAVIFVVLMFLTLLTVGVTLFDFGYNLNLAVALGIALVKATLVGLYFMHLRWDPPIFGFTLVASLGFVALFIAFSLIDTTETLPDVEAQSVQTVSENPAS